jgi:hypothetical protein
MTRRRIRLVAAPIVAVLVFVVGAAVGPGASTPAYAANLGQIGVTVTQAAGFLEELQTEGFTIGTDINPDLVREGTTFPVFLTGASMVQVGTLSQDDEGDYGGSFPATGAVCGTNTVTVEEILDNGLTEAEGTAPIVVQCPQITLDPDTVAQSAEPTTVQVTGTAFTPAFEAPITLNGAQAAEPDVAEDGGFTTPITVSGLACGSYTVTATMVVATIQARIQNPGAPAVLAADLTPLGGGAGLHLASPASTATAASAPLTVTCSSSPPPTQPAGPVTLAANPNVVSVGSVTSVTGTGFAPNTPVTLTWQLAGGVTLPASTTPVTSDGSGNITDPLIVLLPAAPGPCNLVATQGTDTASAPVIVQDGSMEPSTGDQGGDQLIFRE